MNKFLKRLVGDTGSSQNRIHDALNIQHITLVVVIDVSVGAWAHADDLIGTQLYIVGAGRAAAVQVTRGYRKRGYVSRDFYVSREAIDIKLRLAVVRVVQRSESEKVSGSFGEGGGVADRWQERINVLYARIAHRLCHREERSGTQETDRGLVNAISPETGNRCPIGIDGNGVPIQGDGCRFSGVEEAPDEGP